MRPRPFSLIIPAAGSGSRMGMIHNKLFIMLDGRPVLWHTLQAFRGCDGLREIILAIRETDREAIHGLLATVAHSAPIRLVPGGDTRQASVHNALRQADAASDTVWVHDGARPFVTPAVIERLQKAMETATAVVTGVPVKDTIKRVAGSGAVVDTPDRSSLWAVQTPQCFNRELLLAAYDAAEAEGFIGTDDASLMERAGQEVRVVLGEYTNIKITTPEDLAVGEAVLSRIRRNVCG